MLTRCTFRPRGILSLLVQCCLCDCACCHLQLLNHLNQAFACQKGKVCEAFKAEMEQAMVEVDQLVCRSDTGWQGLARWLWVVGKNTSEYAFAGLLMYLVPISASQVSKGSQLPCYIKFWHLLQHLVMHVHAEANCTSMTILRCVF